MIKALGALGIAGKALKLLESYLKNRKQFVMMDTFKSAIEIIFRGVPQGGILAPLLFIIYVNSLWNTLKQQLTRATVSLIQYADDTTIIISSESLEDLIVSYRKILALVKKYFARLELSFNEEKTSCMLFGADLEVGRRLLDEEGIRTVDVVKFLGIWIDTKLTWDEQTNKLTNKLASMRYLMSKARKVLQMDAIKSLYYAHVHSHLSYNILAWGNSRRFNEIFIAQKAVVRAMFGLKKGETCRETFIKHAILTTPSMYIFEVLKFLTENEEEFNRFKSAHSYNTRNGNNIQLSSVGARSHSSGLCLLAAQIFNKLPEALKGIECPQVFLRRVKVLLQEKAYYSLDEYLNSTI